MLAARSPGVVGALTSCGHATDFSTLLKNMMNAKDKRGNPLPPPGYEEPMTKEQCQELEAFVTVLRDLATALTTPARPIPSNPIPNPELRVRPPL